MCFVRGNGGDSGSGKNSFVNYLNSGVILLTTWFNSCHDQSYRSNNSAFAKQALKLKEVKMLTCAD